MFIELDGRMAVRLPPDARWRYERRTRGRADRWGFLVVAVSVLCFIPLVADMGVLNLQWISSLPDSFGFTMFSGHPAKRHQGFAAPLFPELEEHPPHAPS